MQKSTWEGLVVSTINHGDVQRTAPDAVDNPAAALHRNGKVAGHRCAGEMTQQGLFNHHGNESAPQKLVHLVGYRAPSPAAPVRDRRSSRVK